MKRMVKLVLVLVGMLLSTKAFADDSIKIKSYDDILKRKLELNYEFVESKIVPNVYENVALEYHLDDLGLVVIVDYFSINNEVALYVNDYKAYDKYLMLREMDSLELLNNCILSKDTDNVEGVCVLYKDRRL